MLQPNGGGHALQVIIPDSTCRLLLHPGYRNSPDQRLPPPPPPTWPHLSR